MGLFNRKSNRNAGSRDRGRERDVLGDSSNVNLYLFLSDTEWRARFILSDGTAGGEPIGDAFLLEKNSNKKFADTNEIIQRALKEISNTSLRQIGSVSVVLNDPGITLLDNLDRNFSSANVAKIRQYGAESLNCEEVSFGFLRFGPTEKTGIANSRSDQGVFGFADVGVLRRYLGQLGRLAIKIVQIAPAAQNTIFEAQRQPDRTACGIYLGARSTVVVVGNDMRGSVTTRKLPVGLYSLVDAVANANNVSVAEALTALSRRDCLSQVLMSPRIEGESERHVPGQFERILGELVRSLGNEIDRTLRYFDIQRIGGRPDLIKLYGPVANIKGLAIWLGHRLGAEVIDASDSVLDEVISRPRTEGLNLLEGAKSPLIAQGRVKYAWDKDRFRPEHELDADEVAEEKAAATIISGRGIARRDTASGRPQSEGRFAQTKGKPRPRRQRGQQLHPALTPSSQKGSRAGYVLLAVFAFVFLYGGYKTFIAPKFNEFDNLSNIYSETLRRNASLRKQQTLSMAGIPAKRDVETSHDKVLWTEKFLALGCYATKAIWLTDVYLTTASVTATGKPQKIQKLTIKGAVLPSTEGHLLQISEYIRRLEEDKRDLFMGDFKRITFEGATLDYEDVEEIIRFSIEGWYDKNKRVPTNGPKPVNQAVGLNDLSMEGCLDTNQPDTASRKEALLDSSDPVNKSGANQ